MTDMLHGCCGMELQVYISTELPDSLRVALLLAAVCTVLCCICQLLSSHSCSIKTKMTIMMQKASLKIDLQNLNGYVVRHPAQPSRDQTLSETVSSNWYSQHSTFNRLSWDQTSDRKSKRKQSRFGACMTSTLRQPCSQNDQGF